MKRLSCGPLTTNMALAAVEEALGHAVSTISVSHMPGTYADIAVRATAENRQYDFILMYESGELESTTFESWPPI